MALLEAGIGLATTQALYKPVAENDHKKSSAITDFKIEELTKKVNQHNNLIDRMYKVESRITVIEDELKDRK